MEQIPKETKNTLIKDLSPIKLKQSSAIFTLNSINNLIDYAKIYMTLLFPKIFQNNCFNYELHLLDFDLLHYLLSFDSK